jgi:DNA-binding transcriptional regulator YiaG
MNEIPEMTEEQLARAIPARVRKRLIQGRFESGEDIAALRRFVGLTQVDFARAIEISVHTLRNWEQGRRKPEGPAIALLKIAARHPRIIRENLRTAA